MAEPLEARVLLSGFIAYNDTVAGPLTHVYATRYADNGGDSSGQMREITSGAYAAALVSTFNVGGSFGGTGANPASGTDAGNIFGGYVDFTSTSGANAIEISGSASYTYRFENLDPGNTYEFVGTAVRGSDSYTDRWTLVTLVGVDSFTVAHSSGIGVWTAGLAANQVALWTGANHRATQGFVVQWKNIDPGDDGEFDVISQQYTGAIPTSVDPAGVADGGKGYGLNGIRLLENTPSAPPIVVTTPATNIEAFAATLRGEVVSTGGQAPNVRIYYGTTDGGAVAGAWQHWVDVGIQAGTFSAMVGGLSQATPYYFRAYAENSVSAAWAPISLAFTTLTAHAPAVVNQPATNVGAFSAWLYGEVTDDGNDPPLVTVYYGESDGGTSAGAWEDSVEVGVGTGPFYALVQDLDPTTTYYYTARARNAAGDVWATPSLSFETTTPPPLQVTEFMADNATTLATRTRTSTAVPFSGDLTYPDWIEIHNPTDAVAVLDGFYLADNVDNPRAWKFPSGTSIAPGGYLVVFASGVSIKDPALDENGYLHADFKLKDSGGEDVALVNPDGAVVFAIENFPVQIEDTSYGLNAEGEERFFPAPTPGWDNANDVPQAPVFSVASRTFTASVVVDLAARYPTDTVRYTLDESVPTVSSPVWTGPMTLVDTAMLRAVSIGANGKSSLVVSQTYVELGADVLSASSDLPLVIVETFGDAIPYPTGGFGDSFIALFEPGTDGFSRLTDALALSTRGGIHIRGSSSAGFAKKQYRVEFWDESNEDRRLSVLGMPAEADWIFYGPGPYDRALINNPFVYGLSNQIGSYAVRTRWVEMYLNTGGDPVTAADYVGVYAIMEVIESGDDRVDVEPLSTGAGGVPVSGGFIWKNDRGSPYVEPEIPTAAQQTYINSWINGLEAAATGVNFTSPTLGYAAWAEVDTFVDHNLLNMLAMNVDAMRLSGYYYKTADGLLEAGPIWDFDRSLDSTDSRDNNPLWWNGTGDSTLYFNDGSRVRLWWPRMFQDPNFVQRYIDRWFELRQGAFSLASLYATIDAHAAQLQSAAARDYARWSPSRYGTFAGEIQHLKDWLTARINWIDSQWLARPTVNVAGPVVTPGTPVTLSSAVGSVYYTLDGTDPRASGGGISASAILATGPIVITQYRQITARVYYPGYLPSSGAPGYVPSGDDWSAPRVVEYFVNPLVASGDLVLCEINYHPHDATPAELASQAPTDPPFEDNDFEFIELMNVSGHTVNVRGVTITGGIDFEFPSFVLAPGDRIVVVEDLQGFTARYGINGSLAGTGIVVAGQWKGELDNRGDHAVMAARDGSALMDFSYDDDGDWPGRADGKGASLELIDPWAVPASEPDRQAYLEDGNHWRSGNRYGGSPGAADAPDIPIVINEVLTHTDDPLTDAIELHNTSATETVNLGGWWLSDSWGWEWNLLNGDYQKFRIPDGTVLGPGEYVVFYQGHFVGGVMLFDDDEFGGGLKGFGLNSAEGDDVWLMKADASGALVQFVDHVEFLPALNGVSFGRWPDGSGTLYPMVSPTLPGENSGPRAGTVVISEVHYHPAASEDLEFIEICNPTAAPVNLWEQYFVAGQWQDYSWQLEGYEFPAGTTLAPGEALVVVRFDVSDTTRLDAFKTCYGLGGSAVRILGGYGAALDDGGEAVRLTRPDEPPAENPALTPYVLEDEVRYDDEAPWPTGPDGGGTSLHRRLALAWGNDAANWFAAAPSPGTLDFIALPPQVTGIELNDRVGRSASAIEPSGIGVRLIDITFNEAVTFTAGAVTLRKVTFEGTTEVPGDVLAPLSVTGSGTATMRIEFAVAAVVDTWVKVVLNAAGVTSAATATPLDGEPRLNSSGLGYIYKAADDLPSGDGTPGGDAVFYVGSLRGDMQGGTFSAQTPEGRITVWDINGFTIKYLAGNMDADMWGGTFMASTPDGVLTPWDINGFTIIYRAAVAEGRHLDTLPTGTGMLAVSGPAPLVLPQTVELPAPAASAETAPFAAATTEEAAPELAAETVAPPAAETPVTAEVDVLAWAGEIPPSAAASAASASSEEAAPDLSFPLTAALEDPFEATLTLAADDLAPASEAWVPEASASASGPVPVEDDLVDLLALPALDVLAV